MDTEDSATLLQKLSVTDATEAQAQSKMSTISATVTTPQDVGAHTLSTPIDPKSVILAVGHKVSFRSIHFTWLNGYVSSVNSDGTYDIECDDTQEAGVRRDLIKYLDVGRYQESTTLQGNLSQNPQKYASKLLSSAEEVIGFKPVPDTKANAPSESSNLLKNVKMVANTLSRLRISEKAIKKGLDDSGIYLGGPPYDICVVFALVEKTDKQVQHIVYNT